MTDHPLRLVGNSAATRALDADITAAARSDAKVLITGESGVGKEVAARLVHERSARRHRNWVVINCAGVPDSLLESELFGHVRGSFTGAYRDKPGLLEAGHGGTVFLDEIGEMSIRMQALLLRFLETGEIQRIGADRPSGRLDVRVIAATNRVLAERIATNDFREDLFYRLNVVQFQIPPLRERPDDIEDLLDCFIGTYASRHRLAVPSLVPEARARLRSWHWPGNVRELKNVVERLVLRAREGVIRVSDLPVEVAHGGTRTPPPEATAAALAEQVARDLLQRMVVRGDSFWKVVHEPFMARDITRETLRQLVVLGIERGGNYSAIPRLFNMAKDDYKRFLNFLRKHDCLVPASAARASGGDDQKSDARVA